MNRASEEKSYILVVYVDSGKRYVQSCARIGHNKEFEVTGIAITHHIDRAAHMESSTAAAVVDYLANNKYVHYWELIPL